MKELLITLLEEAFTAIAEARAGVIRDFIFPQTEKMIKVAIGIRRCGKSYLLFQRINELLDQSISPEQILFIDFEDDRLLPMTSKEMGALLDEFYSLYPENHKRKCYIFLDEVQNIEDWHQVVRRFFKSKNAEITLSGSSAKLLSQEIHTSLRGRSLAVEVFPFHFNEYREAHSLPFPKAPFSRQTYDVAHKQLQEFLTIGGFPAVQNMLAHEWRETLQGYVDMVILRDIIERHNVSNIALLKYLAKSLLINAASLFSINKFYSDIKSQGYKVSRETLYNYMGYLEDAFLIFSVSIYSESIRAQKTTPNKVYAIDNGLIMAHSVKIHDLYNKLLENQVYLDLKRQGKEIFYYKTQDGYEVDFITIDKEGNRECIQVTWNMADPKTAERESRALEQAMNELGSPGRIITSRDYSVQGLDL